MSKSFSFKGRVLQGLLAFLPLFITLAIVVFIFDFISQFTRPLVIWVMEEILKDAPQYQLEGYALYLSFPISLILSVFMLYGLGVLTQFGFKALLDRSVSRLPFVAGVYASVRQMVDLLGSSDGARSGLFKRVVLIDQSPGVQVLGFMTGVMKDSSTGEMKVCVYVPMPPNPTSGLIHFVSMNKLQRVNWPVEVAMKTLVSAGLLVPSQAEVRPLNESDLLEFLSEK